MNVPLEHMREPHQLKDMSDDEVLNHYHFIKSNYNLIDVYMLTEICARNLLQHLSNN